MFRYHLLGMLRKGTQHGYGLAKEYRSRGGVDSGLGSFYRELQKLVEQGFVRRVANKDDVDPRRAPYEITTPGEEAFDDWFEDLPRASHCADSEMAVRALFFTEVRPETAHWVLNRWESDLWDLTKRLERQIKDVAQKQGVTDEVHKALLHRRLQHGAKDIEFVEDLRNILSLPEADEVAPLVAAEDAMQKRRATGGA
ncbi:MAG: PadR family transcriptional regulator [Candidatus Binatia bacterium]|nr:PadR family transcriptional regulator [Candidatus Binatia bacterium]